MAKKKRIDGRTPNGGDYSEIYFLDAKGDMVDEKDAVEFIIRECKIDGELVQTTYGRAK